MPISVSFAYNKTMSYWLRHAAETVMREGLRVYRDQPETMPELIERSATRRATHRAVSELGGRGLTYEELWEESERVAAMLQCRHEVEPGDRVAFLSANALDLLIGVVAAWRAGGVAVTLSARLTTFELEKQLSSCSPRVVLAQREWLSKVRQPAHELGQRSDDRFEPPRIGGSDPALLVFTSGTTGVSKGVVQSHRNLVSATETWVRCLGLQQSDATVVAAPMHHVTGLNGQSLPILAAGGSVAIMRRFDAVALADLLEAGAASFFHAAPTIYTLALRAARSRHAAGLRVSVSGGSFVSRPLAADVRRFAPGVDFRISYGMTETSSPAVLTPPGWIDERPGDSVGVAVPVNDVRVDGEGEILFRGSTVVTEREWLRSGDLGAIDDRGFVTVLDRIKDVINRGGEKIASLEVEAVLLEHPGVVEAAVVGAQDNVYGEVPKAFLVGDVRVEELRAFAQLRLARFKVPVEFIFVQQLPRNAGGKVLKAELRSELVRPAR